MRNIKMGKTAALIGAAVMLVGCGAHQPKKSQAEIQAQYPRKVTLHTKESLQLVGDSERAFALISKKDGSDQWELIRVSTFFPEMRAGQEVFRVSDDLRSWEATIPRLKDCSKPGRGYSVCASTLAKKDWLGYANYDTEAVLKAVNSIPDEPAKAMMRRYLEVEDATQLAIYEQKSKEQAECYRLHDAGTREIEATGGKAMAAAIAGKPLTNEDMVAIRRVQSRMSSSSACGFSAQPPKKRASAVSAK